MNKNNLSIFLSTRGKSGYFKEFHISHFQLRSICIIGAFLFLFLLGILGDYFFYFAFRPQDNKYQKQNQNLQIQLSQVSRQMEQLNFRLYQIEDFSRKIKTITGIKNSTGLTASIGPLSNTSFPIVANTSEIKNNSIYSSANVKIKELSTPALPIDSMMVYMDHLDKKSQLVHQNITLLMEQLYERQDILSSTPSILPAKGWISSRFGYRKYPFTGEVTLHEGIDIASYPGTPIYVPANGMVIFAGYKSGYGKVLVIDHGYELSTLYGHLSEIMVSQWQPLKRGEIIGTMGSTGNSSGPHLHYEVRISNVPVDPSNYILDTL